MSTEPKQSEMLCFPFRARSLALKPAHLALHRLTSSVMTVVPQSTVRSELPEKHKDKNCTLNNCVAFFTAECVVAHTRSSVILGRTVKNTLSRQKQHDQQRETKVESHVLWRFTQTLKHCFNKEGKKRCDLCN